MVELDRPQMTIRRVHFEYQMAKGTDTLRICNTYCFSTAVLGCTYIGGVVYPGHNIDVCTRFAYVLQTSYTDSACRCQRPSGRSERK